MCLDLYLDSFFVTSLTLMKIFGILFRFIFLIFNWRNIKKNLRSLFYYFQTCSFGTTISKDRWKSFVFRQKLKPGKGDYIAHAISRDWGNDEEKSNIFIFATSSKNCLKQNKLNWLNERKNLSFSFFLLVA